MRYSSGFFIAATGQNVGKTTTSLGLFAGLQKRGLKPAFMKPVGQEHVEATSGEYVDKDVILFKEQFTLPDSYASMSPVIIPQGFTKDFLDGKIDSSGLKDKICRSFDAIQQRSSLVVVEGTGHVGVGSIIDLNNAQVAKLLQLPVILIASAGLGSSFDELTLSKNLCDYYGVRIIGVILNRVKKDKKSMIEQYMKKALSIWGIPLLGCMPYDPLLSRLSWQDIFSVFFVKQTISLKHNLIHFTHIRLIDSSKEIFEEINLADSLIVTPSDREDIILSALTRIQAQKIKNRAAVQQTAFLLTGSHSPRHFIIDQIEKADLPFLYLPLHSDEVMHTLNSYTAKIRNNDQEKVQEAIRIVEECIDFPLLLSRVM